MSANFHHTDSEDIKKKKFTHTEPKDFLEGGGCG